MPRNHSQCVGTSYEIKYTCPCGFTRSCNDKKQLKSTYERHKRFCNRVAADTPMTCIYQFNDTKLDVVDGKRVLVKQRVGNDAVGLK